jgi:AraC family transcriptional regulator
MDTEAFDRTAHVLSSSTECGWKGFPFEFVRSPQSSVFAEYLHPCDFFAVVLKGRGSSRLRIGQHTNVFTWAPGTFVAYRRGEYWDHLAYSGCVHSLNLRCDWSLVPGSRLGSAAEDDVPAPITVPCATDAAITAIANNIVIEAQAACPSGRMYAEALSLALAARVSTLSRELANDKRPSRPSLSRSQLRLVLEYIDHGLAGDLSIAELAALVERSPSHFAGSFRNTVGVTVHRYIVGQRVERARRELSARDKSIAQIASEAGFSSQSHFSEAFRRQTGITPSHHRREAMDMVDASLLSQGLVTPR